MLRGSIKLLILFSICGIVYGQQNSSNIIPDRPAFTKQPNVIPAGTVQIESGIYFNREKFELSNAQNEISTIGIFATTVRISLSEMFELRTGGEYLMRTVKSGVNETNAKGMNALMVGTKFQFLNSGKIPLDGALILEINLPFGTSELKPEKAEPRFYLSASHKVGKSVSLTYNIGSQYQSSDGNNSGFYSICGGIYFDDKISAVLDYYGKTGKSFAPKHFLEAGIMYLQSKNLAVDFLFGKEITAGSDAWTLRAGFSLRVPN